MAPWVVFYFGFCFGWTMAMAVWIVVLLRDTRKRTEGMALRNKEVAESLKWWEDWEVRKMGEDPR